MASDTSTSGQQRTPPALEARFDELSRHIEQWLEEARTRAGAIRDIVSEVRSQPGPAGVVAGSVERETLGRIEDLAQRLETSSDQIGVLNCLMTSVSEVAPRVLLFVVKKDVITGWTARGFSPGFNARSVSFSSDTGNLVRDAVASCSVLIESAADREGNAALARSLASAPARLMLAAPLWVRDRVAAVLYADTGASNGPWFPEAVHVMASMAALSLEALPARSRFPRPAGRPSQVTDKQQAQPVSAPSIEQVPIHTEKAPAPGAPVAASPEAASNQEEAQRFARLLVSEIVLYNAQQIEEGRRNKDLYQRLKDDIERSHEMYQQRVSGRFAGEHDYFREELVRVLADGDEGALILPWG